ncbi:MAG: TetR family transcriptional regulator, partial [Gemmatimonadetes bacterium]|nr:TetR family transcriptional regulator [Gemmatimonadota bacterium]
GERTRKRILEAAAELFAANGYGETRLEDVARCVGVQRAALAYYFQSKQDLYDAVLAEAAGDLVDRTQETLRVEAPVEERLERMVDLWLDAVRERPWLVRLLLRQVAGASPTSGHPLTSHGRRLIRTLEAALREGRRPTRLAPVDAVHLVSVLVGATAFFVSGAPLIAERKTFDPLAPRNLARHRLQLLVIIRRLLAPEEDQGPAGPRAARRRRRR